MIEIRAAATWTLIGLLAGVPSSPYCIDGWEAYPAPILEEWLLLGPFEERTALDPLVTPAALAALYPHRDEPGLGRLWKRPEFDGRLVAPAAAPQSTPNAPAGGWWLGCAWVNVEKEQRALINASLAGARSAELFVDGVPVLRLDAASPRVEKGALALGAGWRRFVLLLEAGEERPGFCVQLLDENARALLHVAEDQLNTPQREALAVGVPADSAGAIQRASRRAIAALDAPYREFGRAIARERRRAMEAAVKVQPAAAQAVSRRFEFIEELAKLVVLGSQRATLDEALDAIAGGLAGMRADGLPFDERWAGLEKRLQELRECTEGSRSVTWHLFEPIRTQAEAWRRLGWARGLLIELHGLAGDILAR